MNDLYNLAKQGDGDAEKQLFEHLFVRFCFLAKRRIQTEDDAEDIAQEACITILEKYKTETFTEGFEQWTYGILKMKIGNYIQKTKVRRRHIVSNPTTTECYASSSDVDPDFKRRLMECLRKILKVNPRYARLLNLIYQGHKTNEICEKLKLKPNNMYVILNRSRSMLRTCLETGKV